jgi:D-xylose transport system permease protein
MMLWGAKGYLQEKTAMPAFIITLGGMMAYRGMAYLIASQEIPLRGDNILLTFGTGTVPLWAGWLLVVFCLGWGAWRCVRAKGLQRQHWWMTAIPYLCVAGIIIFMQLPHAGVPVHARGIAWLSLCWLGTTALCHAIASETVFGRHCYATGGNREAARLSGIPVARVNVRVFIGMGLLVALASFMYLGQLGTAESGAGELAELDAIAACVLGGVSLMGGRGNITAVALGALFMQALTSGLQQCQVATGYQMLIKASVLVTVVALDHVVAKKQ